MDSGGLSGLTTTNELDTHYQILVPELLDNHVVPFLGAGVSTCNREPPDATWNWGTGDFLPTGTELCERLAARFGYRPPTDRDLARVAEFVALLSGPPSLARTLESVFDPIYPRTDVHTLLAELPLLIRRRPGIRNKRLVIVTTNYDDLLESAFTDRGEPFEVVTYVKPRPPRRDEFGNLVPDRDGGKFHHIQDGKRTVCERPNECIHLHADQRATILTAADGLTVSCSTERDERGKAREGRNGEYLLHSPGRW